MIHNINQWLLLASYLPCSWPNISILCTYVHPTSPSTVYASFIGDRLKAVALVRRPDVLILDGKHIHLYRIYMSIVYCMDICLTYQLPAITRHKHNSHHHLTICCNYRYFYCCFLITIIIIIMPSAAEPTNHLDGATSEALVSALANFEVRS